PPGDGRETTARSFAAAVGRPARRRRGAHARARSAAGLGRAAEARVRRRAGAAAGQRHAGAADRPERGGASGRRRGHRRAPRLHLLRRRHGGGRRGRPLGSLGVVSVLSFGRGKGWTGGRGGALLSRGGAGGNGGNGNGGGGEGGLWREAGVLALAAAQWAFARPAAYGIPASLPWLG